MTKTGLIGTVREVHHLKERGRVLVLEWGGSEVRIKPGDAVEVHLPGGDHLPTRLLGVETICGGDFSRVGVQLPREIDSMDIPLGAEVWKT